MKDTDIKAGAVVAFNTLPDAVWFEVLEVNGFNLKVREYDKDHNTDYASQWADTSMVARIRDKR